MRTYLGMAVMLLALGCNNDEELRRVYDEKLQLQTQLAGVHGQQNDKKSEIQRLESSRDELQREIRELTDKNAPILEEIRIVETDLAAAKNKYQQLVNMLQQRREAAVKAYNDAQKQAAEMRNKSKAANVPDEYPYRLFNVTYIGRWRQHGITTTYGVFSIRNYTGSSITIYAESLGTSGKDGMGNDFGHSNASTTFTVPANSTKEAIYIRANPVERLIVRSSVGVERIAEWKKQ